MSKRGFGMVAAIYQVMAKLCCGGVMFLHTLPCYGTQSIILSYWTAHCVGGASTIKITLRVFVTI